MNPEDFDAILEKLVESGFRPPFRFAWVGGNGSVISGSYRSDDAGMFAVEITVSHIVGAGFALPTHGMFIDSDGDAAHVKIGLSGEVAEVDWSSN